MGGLVAIFLLALYWQANSLRFTVGPDDPPPGATGEWSPDVLGLLVSADLADDYSFPNVARRQDGWRLIGPATLHFADGGSYEMSSDTPLWGRCSTLDGDPDRARPRHCVLHMGLAADGATIAWVKVIGESRAERGGAVVVPASITVLINFDGVDEDAGRVSGRGDDVYDLSEDWIWSDERRPGSGHPVFATFDWATGLVTRLEPVYFEG